MLKAIDIALIPSEPLLNYAIELNRNLIGSALVLDRETAMPHLTLAMAVIDDVNEMETVEQLGILAAKYAPLELSLSHIFKHHSQEHGLVSGLGFARSPELMSLHNEVMALIKPYAIQVDENDKSVFAQAQEVNYAKSASWVVNFSKKHAYEGFDPHITVGVGDLDDLPDMKITFNDIALYHLGKFCTCRELISQFSFSDMPGYL